MVIELSMKFKTWILWLLAFLTWLSRFAQIGGNPLCMRWCQLFLDNFGLEKKKRLSFVTSGSVFLEQKPLTFIVRSQDMRKLYPRGDACRHFFFILLNYFQDYCVNELNILPLRFYCFHLSRWIKIAFLYTANIMIMSSVEYSF